MKIAEAPKTAARLSGAITIVKLGGSVITDKRIPYSYRSEVVIGLARAMANSHVRTVVVHGGGSFGHPLAKSLGVLSTTLNIGPRGVSQLRTAMNNLNLKVCQSLSEGTLSPYTFSPFRFALDSGKLGLHWLMEMTSKGFTPVTFADFEETKAGTRIVSSDQICLRLSRFIGARRCIMVLDTDGVLDRDGHLVSKLEVSSHVRWEKSRDTTGGMKEKIEVARAMSKDGANVAFVSGFRPAELTNALLGKRFYGTELES